MATTFTDNFRHSIDEIFPGMVADRRWLHEHPEIGFTEIETSKFVADRLRALGVEDIRTGIAVTGVTGLIRGTGTGPGADRCVLLRADMDALPIEEENDVEYKSRNPGVMHACGHDGHTTILLATARLLIETRSEWAGTVKLCFQPAEENGGGGEIMVKQGVLENPHVDAVFGCHLSPYWESGVIEIRDGPIMAATNTLDLTIQGKGGHGAYPDLCVDPIVVGMNIIAALQNVISREINPTDLAVITVGAFHAGHASNVIPDTAHFRATLRSFNPEVREHYRTRVPEICRGIAAAHRASVVVNWEEGYPATINDPAMADLVRAAAIDAVGEENVVVGPIQMGGEDFSYLLNERPGAYFFVGSANTERGITATWHHPRFDMEETCLIHGAEVMARTVIGYLHQS